MAALILSFTAAHKSDIAQDNEGAFFSFKSVKTVFMVISGSLKFKIDGIEKFIQAFGQVFRNKFV